MSTEFNNHDRLEDLLGKELDGELTPTEIEELNTILRDDADARRWFHSYIDLHTELEWMLNPETLESPMDLDALSTPAPEPLMPRRSKAFAWSGWLAMAASLALFLSLRNQEHVALYDQDLEDVPLEQTFVARANYSSDTQISTKSTVKRQGEWISLGKIILEKGTLGLTFDSGARVVLNAPADFDLETANRGFLNSGQVVAQVPELAIGFIINTPNSTIVDLGTEFTVNVENNQSSVKVIDGEVLAYAESKDGKTEERLLQEDQAVHIDDATSAAFSPADDYSPEVFHDWTRFYEPNAEFVHLSFDEKYDPIISSSAWGHEAKAFTLNLDTNSKNSPQSRVGVFGNGLRFEGDGSFLRTSIEGIAGALPRTVACWIKIPPKQHETDVAIVSWGRAHKGRRWQIGVNQRTEYGTLGAVRTDFGWGYVTGSTDLRDDRWHHIASVYIGGNSSDISAHIRHYIDGKLEAVSGSLQGDFNIETEAYEANPSDNLTVGYREIKNQKQIKTFEGSIDELYLFDAAILPSQIEALKNHNTPEAPQNVTSNLSVQ